MKSILFNTEMVRALLEGRKTVTRRVVKPKPLWQKPPIQQKDNLGYWGNWDDQKIYKASYRPGDVLYVRETFHRTPNGQCWYKADNLCNGCTEDGFCIPKGVKRHTTCKICEYYDGYQNIKWHPSIHMLREAARIFLRVTDVRVERLQDISASACIAEGIPWEDVTPNIAALPDNPAFDMDAVVASLQEAEEQKLIRNSYGLLWDSIIKPKDIALYGWKANPWVWIIEFERIGKEEMQIDG